MQLNLTLQEAYDKAVGGVLKQGGPAYVNHEGHVVCRYRDDRGRACAVGQLIPGEDYDPEWDSEGSAPTDIFTEASSEEIHFLNQLQKAHDNSVRPESDSLFLSNFRVQAVNLAYKFDLTTEVLDQ